MQFSEDDLRAALRRTDPGEPFTERVMAHVLQPQARAAGASRTGSRLGKLWRRLWLRPALTGALAATLVLVGSLGLLHYRNVQRWREGEAAKQQVLLALRITNAKLNHVIERVKTSQTP
ncbi:MAG TPA: hypothetical protein VF740_13205 [Candidatus Acidoferrum sp.]